MNMAVSMDIRRLDDQDQDQPTVLHDESRVSGVTKEGLIKRMMIDRILQERSLQRELRALDFDYDLDD